MSRGIDRFRDRGNDPLVRPGGWHAHVFVSMLASGSTGAASSVGHHAHEDVSMPPNAEDGLE